MTIKKLPLARVFNVSDLSILLGISTHEMRTHINRNKLLPTHNPHASSGTYYDIKDVVEMLIQDVRDSYGSDIADPQTHQERLQQLKAEEQEYKNKVLQGTLVDGEAVISRLASALTVVKTRLLLVPKKFGARAMELLDQHEIEDEMETEIRQILEELSDYGSIVSPNRIVQEPEATTEADD